MTSPRNYQTEAIIIKKTKLGEADSILTLYTPHLGKIQGFAKSLRKTKSKLAGHLELLTHSQVSFARGKNLDTITGSQTITSFLPLKTDLELTSYALYVIELVNQFTPDHLENRPLFQLLLGTLEHLCQTSGRELLLRYFEMHLLETSGYRPQLQQCLSCKTPLQPVINSFSAGAGGMLCPDCSQTHSSTTTPLTVNAQKVLRLLQADDYDTVSRLRVPPELSSELERVMRSYLRYLLEREVKSAAWLDSLKR
ncbi:MAG: DNA repair protein RecO [Chloroflexi bacterium]|nr:DNA repair protein RecO [Chloroflexota bacterium]